MASRHRVLVIDGLSETEQVLKAVLEPRGHQVDRVRSGCSTSEAAAAPSVVVLHLHEPAISAAAPPPHHDVPRVIIGTAELPAGRATDSDEYLPHPFQYRELIQAIERLIDGKAA